MNKSQFLKQLDRAWEVLMASYAGLCERELLEPGVTGEWSVRDIIVHVTSWEEEALTHLPLFLAGGKPPRYSVIYGGIDAFNAWMTKQKSNLSLFCWWCCLLFLSEDVPFAIICAGWPPL